MNRKFWVAASLLALLAFLIPIEHKYDKLFRFFSLTLIPEGLEVSKNYDKKLYFYVSDLIAMALMGIGLLWYKIPARRFFGHPLWIVFLCALASIIASPFLHYPIAYSRLLQLLTPLALFSFVANAFSDDERAVVTRMVFFSILIAALFQSGVAIAQYFQEQPLGLRILGETKTPSLVSFQNGSRWLLDRFFHSETTNWIKMRAGGTFPHANVLGGFLALSLLVTYGLILKAEKGRIWLILTLLPQFLALCFTYSRSALFAWGIGTAIWFFLIYRKVGSDLLRRLALVVVSLAIACGALLYQQMVDRGGIFNYNAVAKGSDSVRLIHQKLSLEVLKDKPLLGLGFAQFSERSQGYFSPDADAYVRSTGPHNIFLFLACETGLISLTAFILSLFLLTRATFQSPFSIEKATLFASFIAFLFIGCCDYYPILFQQGKLMLFLVLGLLAAYTQVKPTLILVVNRK